MQTDFGEFNTVKVFDLNGNLKRIEIGVDPKKETDFNYYNNVKRPKQINWQKVKPKIREMLRAGKSTKEMAEELKVAEGTLIGKLTYDGHLVSDINRKARNIKEGV